MRGGGVRCRRQEKKKKKRSWRGEKKKGKMR